MAAPLEHGLPTSSGSRASASIARERGPLGFGFIDPLALMRIKNLQLRARVVVEGFDKGIHRSPYHGFSSEFSEYRQYTPGDDTRYLDWRLYGRSDRYFIKKFEDETNLRCQLLVDGSKSMGYGSGGVSKWEYARTAAATVAYFLSRQRDAIGLVNYDDKVVDYIPPRGRPGHLALIMAALQREPKGAASDPVVPLRELVGLTARRNFFLIFSDLLVPADAVKTAIGHLRASGHEVLVMRILDPKEVDFSFSESTRFRDLETGREYFVDPAQAASLYRSRFQAHAQQLRQACIGVGADFEQVTTDRPLELVLFDILRLRMSRGKTAARSAPVSAAFGKGGAR